MSENITTSTTLEGAIAVTRFGLGAREGEILAASQNPKEWLREQLKEQSLEPFPMNEVLSSKGYIIDEFILKKNRRAQKDEDLKLEIVNIYNKRNRKYTVLEHKARFSYGVNTQHPFHERLVRFWANHFSVSGRNRRNLKASAFEREAIRPSIMGSFYDLALKATLHPAMLLYLDNVKSVGPSSASASPIKGFFRKKGLNENLAREVMELYTLTPKANYTQNDVTEFAKALTGWTIGGLEHPKKNQGVEFFDKKSHEPGQRTILNKTYFPLGEKQAPVIIRNLCEHSETAANVSLKLARHFVSDIPPQKLVEQLTQTFIQTNGDLPSVYKALIEASESWVPQQYKIKTPDELLISTARILGTDNTFPTFPRDIYEGFGQLPYAAPSPEGWPDNTEAWLGPDAVTKRVEWANALAAGNPNIDARKFLTKAVGLQVSEKTTQLVTEAESGHQALVLALMSPEFQRR